MWNNQTTYGFEKLSAVIPHHKNSEDRGGGGCAPITEFRCESMHILEGTPRADTKNGLYTIIWHTQTPVEKFRPERLDRPLGKQWKPCKLHPHDAQYIHSHNLLDEQ